MKSLRIGVMTAAMIMSCASMALAIPFLQLYLEGGTYDTSTESWTITTNNTFKLWVLAQDGVYDVKLAAAYASNETGSISLTPTTATASLLAAGFPDTTTPTAPVYSKTVTDGSRPIMGGGATLPGHGTYGTGVSWMEWKLGDLLASSDKVADMTANTLVWKSGQLNAYDVTITGFSTVSFDAYDHIVYNNDKNRYVKAPFSHDAEVAEGLDVTPVPEPGTLVLMGAGLLVAGLVRRRSRK